MTVIGRYAMFRLNMLALDSCDVEPDQAQIYEH